MDFLTSFLFVHTFAAGIAGMFALLHAAAWKLSTESIESPRPLTRWLFRYLIFSFFFFVSFLGAAPITTWQLIKPQVIQEFSHNHPWLLFALALPPAAVLYYLHRKFVIWADPRKIRGRKDLQAKLAARSRR